MELKLYNSLTKQIEPFVPLHPPIVGVYHCGPTVYKRQHIGNMRRFLFADFLNRTLKLWGYEVHDVTNITDVGHLTQDDLDTGEDKLAKAAAEAKVTPQLIAQEQTKLFMADLAALQISPSWKYPKATDHIPNMQAMIQILLDKGFAYQTPTGIYFSVEKFPSYGQLSGNTLAHLNAGARIKIREDKHNPADFALWKFDDTALQKWDSPWGTGYPGWHIECSAMSQAYLGTTLDIHTGGEDNRFPHHENEIAQSEAATGQPFVRFWLHNRHLMIAGQKMAKRAGEVITIDTIRDHGVSPLAFRLLVFGSHYRSPMSFSWDTLAAAQENLNSLKLLVSQLPTLSSSLPTQADTAVVNQFTAALADDLNTPAALAVVSDYIKVVNKQLATGPVSPTHLATLKTFDTVLGILEPLQIETSQESAIPTNIQQLAQQREVARNTKAFAEADRLRKIIEEQGYVIDDTPTGPRLRRQESLSH